MRPAFGDWRSLVAHFVRDEGVGGSNPLSPTKFRKTQPQGWVFCFLPRKSLRPKKCLMAASPYQAYAIQQNHQCRRPDKRSRAIRQNHQCRRPDKRSRAIRQNHQCRRPDKRSRAIRQNHRSRRPDKRLRAIRQTANSAVNPSGKNQNPPKLPLSLLPAA